MSLFYNEKVIRRKTPFLVLLVVLLLALLILSQAAKAHIISHNLEMVLDTSLILAFLLASYFIIRQANVQLKYSLMPEEFIVHEIQNGKYRVKDRIQLDSVKSFEPVTTKEKLICAKKDAGCLFYPAWKLTYRQDGRSRFLILRPSERMAQKIERALALP